MQGQPILVKGEEIGVALDVAISYGEDLKSILDEWQKAGFNIPDIDVGRTPRPGETLTYRQPED